MLVKLKFENRTAGDSGPPEVIEMQINREAVSHIMDWYGAYYAGDDYDVRLNGTKLQLGINGEYEMPTIEAVPARPRLELKE